ncbi:ABC transporter permease subunit [Chloroflexota bacterium]
MDDPNLQEAEQLISSGQYQEAQAILAKVLLVDQDNEHAWLLMAQVSAGNQEKIHCLRQALRIDPHNQKAIRKLRYQQAWIQWEQSLSIADPNIQQEDIDQGESIQPIRSSITQKGELEKAPLSPFKIKKTHEKIRDHIFGILPFLKFLGNRIIYLLGTLILSTIFLYGAFVWFLPPEARAMAYIPPWGGRGSMENRVESTIETYGFRDPFPVQYFHWATQLLQGDWGVSTAINDEVLDILLIRTPATAELVIFAVLIFVPLGLVSGVAAGWKQGKTTDHGFRLTAFIATSIPPFVLGLMLLSVFYIGLHWFPPGRVSLPFKAVIDSPEFNNYTHLLVLDGLLNGRFDIALDALRHLILPAFTLSLTYWATLGRVTRAVMIDELQEDYVITARGKGLSQEGVVWQHAFRNSLVPGLNSIALSAAMFMTNAIIIEIIFGYPGISKPLTQSFDGWVPDVYMAMGFAVYSMLFVLPLMFILDIIQAMVDPRIREENKYST